MLTKLDIVLVDYQGPMSVKFGGLGCKLFGSRKARYMPHVDAASTSRITKLQQLSRNAIIKRKEDPLVWTNGVDAILALGAAPWSAKIASGGPPAPSITTTLVSPATIAYDIRPLPDRSIEITFHPQETPPAYVSMIAEIGKVKSHIMFLFPESTVECPATPTTADLLVQRV